MPDAASNDPRHATSGANPVPIIKHSKFFFDNTLVVIQIENVQFNVHKYQLIKSGAFSDMFAIADQAQEEGKSAEGSSTDNPIKMEGVSASDFECLLTVLYATHFSTHQPDPEASLIIPAFRLANMWNFADLRAYLVPLAEKVLSDADKIVFAREFNIDSWLTPAYARLCQRKELLTSEEATKIGVEGVLLIFRIREGGPSVSSCCDYRLRCNNCHANGPATHRHWAEGSDTEIRNKIDEWTRNGRVFANNN